MEFYDQIIIFEINHLSATGILALRSCIPIFLQILYTSENIKKKLQDQHMKNKDKRIYHMLKEIGIINLDILA